MVSEALTNSLTIVVREVRPFSPSRCLLAIVGQQKGLGPSLHCAVALRIFMKFGGDYPAASDLTTLRLLVCAVDPLNLGGLVVGLQAPAWRWSRPPVRQLVSSRDRLAANRHTARHGREASRLGTACRYRGIAPPWWAVSWQPGGPQYRPGLLVLRDPWPTQAVATLWNNPACYAMLANDPRPLFLRAMWRCAMRTASS